jgi:DNA-binding NarL/FixJ family response regulator
MMRAHVNDNETSSEVISLHRWAAHRAGGERSPAIRVLLADGARLVRAAVRALLESEPGIKVVAEAATGEEAVAVAIETRPDVILMDVSLPGQDGLQTTRQILATPGLSDVSVLILSADDLDEGLFGALRAGATGFIVKDTQPVELLRAVHVLAGGGAQLSPGVTRRLLQEFASRPDAKRVFPAQLEELTAREREVMTLVAFGLTNDEIAERLVISPATAKTHVSRAMVKLHIGDRAKLVALAYETGFVQPRQHESVAEFDLPTDRGSRGDVNCRRAGISATATGRRARRAPTDLRVGAL